MLATDARALLVRVEAFNVLIKTLVKFCLNHRPRMAVNRRVCEACLGHDRLFADMMMMLLEVFLLTLSLFDC